MAGFFGRRHDSPTIHCSRASGRRAVLTLIIAADLHRIVLLAIDFRHDGKFAYFGIAEPLPMWCEYGVKPVDRIDGQPKARAFIAKLRDLSDQC